MKHNMKEADLNYFKDAVRDCFLGDHPKKEMWNLRYQTLCLLNRMVLIYPEDVDEFLDILEAARGTAKTVKYKVEEILNEE